MISLMNNVINSPQVQEENKNNLDQMVNNKPSNTMVNNEVKPEVKPTVNKDDDFFDDFFD